MNRGLTACAAAALAIFCQLVPAQTNPLLKPQPPVAIPGGPGGFDWMRVDTAHNRVFATHKGTRSVAVIDLSTNKPLPSPAVGTAQGIAFDYAGDKIFLGDEEEKKVVVLNARTLKKTGEIKVDGPVDDILFCEANGKVYADCDDGTVVWVIDAKTEKITAKVTIKEAPEKLEYDAASGKIYQNIKSADCVQVIDPKTNKVVRTLPTAPAAGPHGLAIDAKRHRVYSAGNNGKLVAIDIETGKVCGSTDIAKGTDQIAFDPGNDRIYCACKGSISVVAASDSGVKLLGNVESPAGAHTITVDTKTHAVWICYADKSASWLRMYLP